MDFTCDLRCPPVPDNRKNCAYCCWGCDKATSGGCPEPRDKMPESCKTYDCKDYKFYMAYQWFPEYNVWGCTMLREVHKDKADDEFMDKINAAFPPITDSNSEKKNDKRRVDSTA